MHKEKGERYTNICVIKELVKLQCFTFLKNIGSILIFTLKETLWH